MTHNSIYGMFSSRHGAESPLPPHPRGVPETKGLPSTRLTVPAPPGLRQEGTLHARVGFRGRRPIFALRLPLHARARIGVAVCHSMPLISPPHARARLGPLGGHRSGPCARLCGTRHVKHAGGIHTAGCPAQAKPRAAAGSRALLSAKIPRASKAKRHAPSMPRRIRNTARQRPTGPRARRKEQARRLQGIPGIDGEGHARPLCPRDYEGSEGIRREGYARPLWGARRIGAARHMGEGFRIRPSGTGVPA